MLGGCGMLGSCLRLELESVSNALKDFGVHQGRWKFLHCQLFPETRDSIAIWKFLFPTACRDLRWWRSAVFSSFLFVHPSFFPPTSGSLWTFGDFFGFHRTTRFSFFKNQDALKPHCDGCGEGRYGAWRPKRVTFVCRSPRMSLPYLVSFQY